jgi:hypothetical protein
MTPAPPASSRERELAGQVEDALMHFDIGLQTWSAGLPVDWQDVALKMASCLGEWVTIEGVEVLVLPGWPGGGCGKRLRPQEAT